MAFSPMNNLSQFGAGNPLQQRGGFPGGGGQNQMMQMMQMMMALMMNIMAQQMGGGFPGGGQPGMGGAPGQGGFSPIANPGFGGGFPGGGGCGCGGGFPGAGGFPGNGGIPGVGNFGGGSPRGGPGSVSGGPSNVPNVPPAGNTNNRIANQAMGWNGRAFKPGQTHRCADFVSHVLQQAGAPVRPTVRAADFANQGSAVGRDQMRPGDVVLFGNTYRRGQYTHVGIYVGEGKFVHRPTANKPVRIDNMNSGYYSQRFTGARRFPSN